MSGGLDSIIAAKVVKDLPADVTMLHFILPWKDGTPDRINQWAELLGVKLVSLQLDDHYMNIVRHPPHGHGSAMNPCIDCKIHMLQRAKKYMEETQANFIFTGEVLGQRPMSQNKKALQTIEKKAGLEGYLLRPLSAKLMPPTIPEQNKIINREKLLSISGRSRHIQIELAGKFNIDDFSQPAGGCLLTEQSFCQRLKDCFNHGYKSYCDTKILSFGRHFRINSECKVIAGRNEIENNRLFMVAGEDDILMRYEEENGPFIVLQDNCRNEENLMIAAGILQYFSKLRDAPPQDVLYWQKKKGDVSGKTVKANKITEKELNNWKI